MTAKDILLYQVGNRGAIERVAASPATFLTGLLLVLITGIPRNYDQIYFLESWRWLYGPLAFSLVSGTWMYFVARTRPAEKINNPFRWRAFMGLFWMTAPMAWIYAIPFERMLPVKEAAANNFLLLGLVSLGRVLLLSRVLSVLQGGAFVRSLFRVLLAASVEAWGVTIFSRNFGMAIMRGMAGMRNAPEEDLAVGLAKTIVFLGWILIPLFGLAVFATKAMSRVEIRPIPNPTIGLPAGRIVGMAALCWVGIAVGPQMEQQKYHRHEKLTRTEGYGAALDYLSSLRREELPPQRRLRPSPYEYEAWWEYPKCFAAMDGAEAPWVSNHFRAGLDTLLENRYIHRKEGMISCLEAIVRLDGNTKWIEARRAKLSRVFESHFDGVSEDPGKPTLGERLKSLGIHAPEQEPSKPEKVSPPNRGSATKARPRTPSQSGGR